MFYELRQNKTLAFFMAIVFALTIILPLLTPAPANAASTYSEASRPSLTAGTLYHSNINEMFNRITVEIPAGQLIATSTIRVSAPSDYGFHLAIPNPTPIGGHTNQVLSAVPAQVDSTIVTPPVTVGRNVYNEWQVTVTPQASTEKGVFYLDFYSFYVPSGASGDAIITIEAPPQSSLSSKNVIVGTVGSGKVDLTMSDVKTIATPSGTIDTLRIKEDRAGALVTGNDSVKIKLPSGFKWSGITDGQVVGNTNRVWGNLDLGLVRLTTADDKRTLVINLNNGTTNTAVSTQATYFTLTGLNIEIDDSVAKLGDVVATISGNSTLGASELTVAKYGDFAVTVNSFDDPKDVTAGRTGQEIGKFVIEEGIAKSLLPGRTITLQLVGGAKWNISSTDGTLNGGPTIDASNSKNSHINTNWSFVGSNNDTIRLTTPANYSTSAAKIVLQKGEIAVAPDATGDIKIKVGGTAGAAGEVVVAKVIKPVDVAIDGEVAQVAIGVQSKEIAPIVITETKKERIQTGTLRLVFPHGVMPPTTATVEVIEGDLVISQSSIGRGSLSDGRWTMDMTVTSTSSKPSKVKISGLKLTVDRTVPEGSIIVAVSGSALVRTTYADATATSPKYAIFPTKTHVAGVVVANTATPAPVDSKQTAAFVIGSTTYTVNGVEQTMDVAPYVKDGRTYLPVRYVANALGVDNNNIMWDSTTGTATLLKGDKVVQVKVGSKSMIINGAAIAMDAAPEIKDGRTMLPFRWIAWAFGANVEWDAATQTVTIN